MYGFLRPNTCQLSPEDRATYRQFYCGQCVALHRLFGYTKRSLVSYDATFLGLLVSAQMEEEQISEKDWCGVFPKKMTIASPEAIPQVFSAALASLIFSIKVADKSQDGGSVFAKTLEKFTSQQRNKTLETLYSLGFPVSLFQETLALQVEIERQTGRNIEDYAEPTAWFLGHTFRFTAILTGKRENEAPLYDIGYHIGKIIYLIDSCLDILDDLEKNSFNALLAAFANNESPLSIRASSELEKIAFDSLSRIKAAVKNLHVKGQQSLIKNILFNGFPVTLHCHIKRTQKSLTKRAPQLLKYTPHAALASTFCLFSAQNAEAGWGWGKIAPDNSLSFYGIFCCESADKECVGGCSNLCFCAEMCINPFLCVIGNAPCSKTHCCVCIPQLPKIIIIAGAFFAGFLGLGDGIIGDKFRYLKKRRERSQKEKEQRQHEREELQHKRLAEERFQSENKNRNFINTVSSDLGSYFTSLSSFFKTPQYSVDYSKLLNDFVKYIKVDKYLESESLKEWIDTLTTEAKTVKTQLEKAQELYKNVTTAYQDTISTVRSSGQIHLIKECEYLKGLKDAPETVALLSQGRWEDYHSVMKSIVADLKELKTISHN